GGAPAAFVGATAGGKRRVRAPAFGRLSSGALRRSCPGRERPAAAEHGVRSRRRPRPGRAESSGNRGEPGTIRPVPPGFSLTWRRPGSRKRAPTYDGRGEARPTGEEER